MNEIINYVFWTLITIWLLYALGFFKQMKLLHESILKKRDQKKYNFHEIDDVSRIENLNEKSK